MSANEAWPPRSRRGTTKPGCPWPEIGEGMEPRAMGSIVRNAEQLLCIQHAVSDLTTLRQN